MRHPRILRFCHHQPHCIEEIHAMTTKIVHNEAVEQTADISTIQPLGAFQFDGSDLMLVSPASGGTPASAINLDTGAVVPVPAPNVVTLLDLVITVTDTPAPAAPASP
jgi:hypothetical protein